VYSQRSTPQNEVSSPLNDSQQILRSEAPPGFLGQSRDFWIARLAMLAVTCAVCYGLAPFGIHGLRAAAIGFAVAAILLLTELRMRRAQFGGLVGGMCGALLGLVASLLITLVVSRTAEPEATKSLLEFGSLFAFGYLGLVVGSSHGSVLRDSSLPMPTAVASPVMSALKLLDTSVLIDGRIADICDTHFLDGPLGIPRFILHELQHVADSQDALKRQRGRRGLEVLERMQKLAWLEIRVLEQDIPGTTDVDQKLIGLARCLGAKIVTNDFNLNKVARVQGIAVLNINELANALKAAVMPGEAMRVMILREGKESSQGVAYLEDGTMVVVDGARRYINRTIDIVVTSMHQTPAGKMIFGKVEERGDGASGPRTSAGANGSVPRTERIPADTRLETGAPATYSRQEQQ
jgi:uncharacterized protein YacL